MRNTALMLALAICVPLLPGEEAAPKSPLEVLPGDAHVALVVPDAVALKALFADSNLGAFWGETEVQQFAAPVVKAARDAYAQMRAQLPALPPLEDLVKLCDGSAGISLKVADVAEERIEVALCLRLKDLETAGRLLAPMLGGKALEAGKTIALHTDDEHGPALRLEGKLLLAASSAAVLEDLVKRAGEAEPANALASNERLVGARKLLEGEAQMVFFADLAKLIELLVDMRKHEGNDEEFLAMLKASGYDSLDGAVLQVGRRDRAVAMDLSVTCHAAADSMLGKALRNEPLPADILKIVPEDAAWFTLTRYDSGTVLQDLRKVQNEQERAAFEEGLKQLNEAIGLDLEKDLLANLGDHFLLYDSGGRELLGIVPGMVISTDVKDAIKARAAFNKLFDKAKEHLNEMRGGGGAGADVRSVDLDGVTVHYLTMDAIPLTPAFTLFQNRVFLGTSVASLRQALGAIKSGRSVLDQPELKAALERAMGQPCDMKTVPGYFSFTHPQKGKGSLHNLAYLGKLVVDGIDMQMKRMAAWGMEQPTAQKMAQAFWQSFDFALFPSDEVFLRHARPAATVMLSKEGGIVYRTEFPVPHAEMLGQANVYTLAVGAGMLLPVMARARASARRTSDASNLSQFGKACAMWADSPANGGKYPDHLEDLYDDYVKDKRLFLNPQVPAGKHHPGRGEVEHNDYIYIPGSNPTQATNVLAYSRKKDNRGKGRSVLIVAGSVEWIEDDETFREMLTNTLNESKIPLSILQPAPAEAQETNITAEQMAQALKDLSNESFSKREEAEKLLRQAGNAAKGVLEEGAKSKDVEVATRCKNLLQSLDQTLLKQEWVKAVREDLGLDK